MLELNKLTKQEIFYIIKTLEYFYEEFDYALKLYIDYKYDNKINISENKIDPYWFVDNYLIKYNFELFQNYFRIGSFYYNDFTFEVLDVDYDIEISIDYINNALNHYDVKRKRKYKLEKLTKL